MFWVRAARWKEVFRQTGRIAPSASGPTVVSVVGVNGTGKTTTAAKLAHLLQARGDVVLLAACDTFRAAAIEQIKLWGQRLHVPVIAGADNAGPSRRRTRRRQSCLRLHAKLFASDTAGVCTPNTT